MENFKKYHNIEKDITLESKVENSHLFVLYKDQWIQLTHKKNPDRFYGFLTLRRLYGIELSHEIGLTEKNKKYNRKYYLKNKEAFCKASKKYYAKKCTVRQTANQSLKTPNTMNRSTLCSATPKEST